MAYNPVGWVDGKTPVNAENLGKMDDGIKAANDAIDEINTAWENGEFKGDKGDTGNTGPQGPVGADGKTPVKGVDYWTEADQESIVQQVITALGTPVFGTVDAENNIILTGKLSDGNYTLKYEDADGNLTEIGTIEVGGATYTNQIPISIDTDGSVYNGTGYKTATRLNSSGGAADVHNTSASNPVFLTGFIPVKTGDIIRMKNCYADYNGSDTDVSDLNYFGSELGNLRFWTYHDTFGCAIQIQWSELLTSSYVTATADSNGHVTEFTYNGEAPYIRMCLAGDPATAIVTINEEITD